MKSDATAAASDAASAPTPSSRFTAEAPGTLRATVVGAVVGVVLAFAGVAGVLLLHGEGAATAFGLGGMAAFWGGLGFGSMLGGTLHLVRHPDEPGAPARGTEPAPDPSQTSRRPEPAGPRPVTGQPISYGSR